jgi:hypothetical protein
MLHPARVWYSVDGPGEAANPGNPPRARHFHHPAHDRPILRAGETHFEV